MVEHGLTQIEEGLGYPEWPIVAEITITNPVTTEGFQHKLELTWQAGMRQDFSDIRFSQENGIQCPYWIRSDNIVAGTSCEVWIKVPSANQSKLYIHWGNAGAISESNGDKTFKFFDDFTAVALDTGKWVADTTNGATVSITNSVLSIIETGTGICSVAQIYALRSAEPATIIARVKSKHSANASYSERFGMGTYKTAYFSHNNTDQNGKYATYAVAGGYEYDTIAGYTEDTFCIMRCKITSTSAVYDVNGADTVTPGADHITSGTIGPVLNVEVAADSQMFMDWCFVAEYAATDPTLALSSAISTQAPTFFPLNYGSTLYAEEIAFTVRYGFIASGTSIRPTQSSLLIGGSSSRDLAGKTWVAKARYNKGTTGGISSTLFDQAVSIIEPDHNAVDRCIFHGYYPSQTAVYCPGDNSEEFTGYDYAQKLSGDVLPDILLSLLSPADQGTTVYQRMDYKNITHQFHQGKIIQGGISGATARIAATPNQWVYAPDRSESYYVPTSELVIINVNGTFQDSETITEIGGTGAAYVNGALMPLDFPVSTYYPEIWLREVLGGDNWQNTTGIYPYRLNPVGSITGTWTAKPYSTWDFQSEETKAQAIESVFTYHDFITLVKWKDIGFGGYTPCMYAVHQDDIDIEVSGDHQGLDLPAMVTITNPDPYLVGTVMLDIVGEGRINKVTIRCQDIETGEWYQNTRVSGVTESAAVFSDNEIPQTYAKTDPNLVSQADCDTAAALLYTYLSQRLVTYKMTFIKRTDLELLQLLTFSGYTEIPDGEYRIIHIEYEWEAANLLVHVTVIPSAQFKASLNVNRMYVNSTIEVKRIIQAELAKTAGVQVGTVTAVSSNKVSGTTEGGIPVISRAVP